MFTMFLSFINKSVFTVRVSVNFWLVTNGHFNPADIFYSDSILRRNTVCKVRSSENLNKVPDIVLGSS